MDARNKLLLLFAISFGYVTEVYATEKRITRADLPPEVQKKVEIAERTAKVLGFSQETEGKRTTYEVELMENGHRKDVLIDGAGNVLEVEEEIPFESLPGKARQILQDHQKYGRVKKAEKLVKHGILTAYEVEISKDSKTSEIEFRPDGEQAKTQN